MIGLRTASLLALLCTGPIALSAAQAQERGSKTKAPVAQVDINTATASELSKLPGIGPAIAERIVVARKKKVFRTPRELRRVRGIGFRTLQKLEPWIVVGSAKSATARPRAKRKKGQAKR